MDTTISAQTIETLKQRALQLRIDSVRATTSSKSGHPTSCLSAADIIATLFFHVLRLDLSNPGNPNNDRFILSKGHAVPVVYAAWKQLGVISDQELMKLRDFDSELEGHPTPRFAHNEAATGSLGQGLGIGAGMALHAKKTGRSYTTYVMLGDGEVAEGSIWEAAEFCGHNELSNLIGIIDVNRLAQSGESVDSHDITRYKEKWQAFGWHTFVIDGHNIEDILEALQHAQDSNRPVMIIAKTYKGYGLHDQQDKNGFHGKPIPHENLEAVLTQLKNAFEGTEPITETDKPASPDIESTPTKSSVSLDLAADPNSDLFSKNEKLATRKAFGYGLAAAGRASENIYAFDGDVKNSTFTQTFEDEFPERFVQSFIAEQNMVSLASGFALRGATPFAATFAAFFSRAFDQIRMASIGRVPLRLAGSHSGVSIGQDGPSQMGLEDLAMMQSLPDSMVLYPSDAVAAYKMVELMANYNEGISYMRTTRAATPIIYSADEQFPVGSCKVLKQSSSDVACVVAAGITLHEALKAYELLQKENINIAIIDLYCIKPLDTKTLLDVATKSQSRIITVEDHYLTGGIGQTVCHALRNNNLHIESLAVPHISRSGTPEKLLAFAQIDADHIAKKTKEFLNR